MWPYSLTIIVLVGVILATTLAASINNDDLEDHKDSMSAITSRHVNQEMVEGRGLRKAIIPLMMGIILKVGSLLPMKYMILIFFAIAALIMSKFALILTAVFGTLHLKSIKSNHRYTNSIPYSSSSSSSSESFTPYNTFNSDSIGHGGGFGGIGGVGSNGGHLTSSSQFTSFASGDGTSGFDTQTPSSFITAAAASSNVPLPPQKRRRIYTMYG